MEGDTTRIRPCPPPITGNQSATQAQGTTARSCKRASSPHPPSHLLPPRGTPARPAGGGPAALSTVSAPGRASVNGPTSPGCCPSPQPRPARSPQSHGSRAHTRYCRAWSARSSTSPAPGRLPARPPSTGSARTSHWRGHPTACGDRVEYPPASPGGRKTCTRRLPGQARWAPDIGGRSAGIPGLAMGAAEFGISGPGHRGVVDNPCPVGPERRRAARMAGRPFVGMALGMRGVTFTDSSGINAGLPGQRKVLQPTLVPVMHARRHPAAGRTCAFTASAGQPHQQPAHSVHRGGHQYPEALEQHVLPGDLVMAHALDVDTGSTVQPGPAEHDGSSKTLQLVLARPGSQAGIEQPLHRP